jgi:hypothetical protein
LQDFVKWKGPLFHKFTLSLVDSSHAVRHLAEYLLADTLALKVSLHRGVSSPPPLTAHSNRRCLSLSGSVSHY